MATKIQGIAASENIDSSGEVLLMSGLDITSLDKDGTLNFEHKSDLPGQTVGKILTAKKIMTEDECSSDNEKFFWSQCQVPFLYITGELFDDYNESAKDIAGLFMYSAANSHEHDIVGFSIEGAKIDKNGMYITKSIARKVTITVTPCNKAAIAKLMPENKPVKDSMNDLFDQDIFKSESSIAIQLLNAGTTMEKADKFSKRPYDHTSTGKPIHINFEHPAHKDFTPAEHHEAAAMHADYASGHGVAHLAPASHISDMHTAEGKKHTEAANMKKAEPAAPKAPKPVGTPIPFNTETRQKIKAPEGWQGTLVQTKGGNAAAHYEHPMMGTVSVMKNPETNKFDVKHAGNYAGVGGVSGHGHADAKSASAHAHKYLSGLNAGTTGGNRSFNMPSQGASGAPKAGQKEIKKALTAGSGNVAPSQLAGGAALVKESLDSGKKKWSKRAKEEYKVWGKKEEFRDFMHKRMPNLTLGEIDSIGSVIAMNKSLKAEKILAKSMPKKPKK